MLIKFIMTDKRILARILNLIPFSPKRKMLRQKKKNLKMILA